MHYLRLVSYLIIIIISISCNQRSDLQTGINLVPEETNTSPDYWCTWGAQNYATDSTSVKHTLALGGHSVTAGYLTEKNLFGEDGWSEAFPGILKQDMILLFDLGWDVPTGLKFESSNWELGSLLVAEDKFPSCTGSAEERLMKLNRLVLTNGWKGTGLWLPSHPHGDRKDGIIMADKITENYYREGLTTSKNAGIKYWKIDYGFRGDDLKFREMITRMVEEYAPGMYVEHARGGGPLNDEECPWDTKNYHKIGSYRTWDDGGVLQKAVAVAKITHVFRTYDITQQLSIPTTLDRVAQILLELSGTGEKVIINCEDEPYLGAVLGCALGILRHPDDMEISGYNYDLFGFKHRIDEVTRAVRWHRIAPALGAGLTDNILDTVMLTDSWKFQQGDAWATWVTGREVIQIAPARVARGMKLPDVKCEGEPPYVICSKHPDGTIAVGTLPRVSSDKKIYYPLADVTVQSDDINNLIGIFGRFNSLTILLPADKDFKIDKIYGQDLAGESAIDITKRVDVKSGKILIPGEVIDMIGLSSASEGDLSEPGMVMKIIYQNHFKHVDQVLWVNEDLNNTISHWKNLGFDQIVDLDTVDAVLKKSGKTIRLKVAKANLGGANITWIQTVGGESVFNQFQTLSGNGAMSLVYRLDNEKAIQEEIARLAAIGINVKEEITLSTKRGKINYVLMDTKDEGKFYLGYTWGDEDYELMNKLSSGNLHNMQLNQYAFALLNDNIENVSGFWRKIGFPEFEINHPKLGNKHYYGTPVDHDLIQGWQRQGDIAFEWCIPVSTPIVYDDHIKKHGEGIHHLAYAVKDMDTVLNDYRSKGYVVSMGGTWGEEGKPGSGRYEYIDLENAGGLTMELLWSFEQ